MNVSVQNRPRTKAKDERPRILGVPVSSLSMAEVLGEIENWIATGERNYICVADVHALLEVAAHQDLHRVYDDAAIVTPDGMPLVWCLRRRGAPYATRVCGPDLLPAVLRHSEERGYRHFFYGSSEATLARVKQRLERDYPHARLVGMYSPPYRVLTEPEQAGVVRLLNEAAPDIVWVGLGAPKQERWMAAHRAALSASALIGVGAAFDVFAGTIRRAPRMLQQAGLEWAYRIAQEPRRLTNRYLRSNSRFAARIVGEELRLAWRAQVDGPNQ